MKVASIDIGTIQNQFESDKLKKNIKWHKINYNIDIKCMNKV